MFVAQHLQTLIEAGDDPATADLDPDADAVAVLTVHKAKGLEFPVVYLPGLVAGRFPGNGRGDPLALPAGPRPGRADDARTCAGRGAPPLLRRDDPGTRRAGVDAMPPTTAAHAPAGSRRSCSRRSTCRRSAGTPGAGVVPPSAEERLAGVRGRRRAGRAATAVRGTSR